MRSAHRTKRLSCRAAFARPSAALAGWTSLALASGARAARGPCRLPAALRAGLLEARLQSRHEIEHPGAFLPLGLGDLDLLAFHFRANDLHQVRAIVVRVLLRLERFGEVGDARGFIVVTPSGSGEPLYWNAHTGGPATPDDVAFVRDLLAKLDASLCTDTSRAYVAGYSMGGAMAELIACEMPDRIAAVGLVAAVSIACGAKVPMIDFHGTDDIAVPFEGADANDPRGASPPVRRVASEWARVAGCDGLATISRPFPDIELSTFHNCTVGDGQVLLYTVINGGHTWPGAKLEFPVGHTTQSIDASSLMLDFFKAHAKRA